MGKFYAVKKGRKIGVFDTWEECKRQVDGFPSATYKSFTSYEDAKLFAFDEGNKDINPLEFKAEITAYIDGSYNDKQKYYSYASIIFDGNKKLTFATAENELDILDQRNVAGEIKAAIQVIEYALSKNAKSIEIFYDYAGIEKWAKKEWKAKNSFTQKYANFIQMVSPKIKIVFSKVKSHSGNKFNDEVDLLAKEVLKDPNKKIEGVYDLETEDINIEYKASSNVNYADSFDVLKGTKKNISLGLIMENQIYSSERIFEAFRLKWKQQNRKVNEYIEIKAAFDFEKGLIIILVLNNKGERELIELGKGDMELNG